MVKNIVSLFLLFFSFTSLTLANEDYREKMKELIKEIRLNTNKEIIITQNGSEIYFKNNKLDLEFLSYVNGASQESLFYGEEGKLGKKTSSQEKNSLLKNLTQIRDYEKIVFDINYSKNKTNRKDIEKEIIKLQKQIAKLSKELDFENAIIKRDEMTKLKKLLLDF